MNLAILCEYSGMVRNAFTRLGHNALSVDLLETETDGRHFKMDVFDFLDNCAGVYDLIIAHPPCTALCVSGNGTYADSDKRTTAIEWTLELWRACMTHSPRICFENPVGILSSAWRPPDQYINPWQFGRGECKRTGLWLRGLPLLEPTDYVAGREQLIHTMSPSPDRGKKRSLFYPEFADAMADQWGQGFHLVMQAQP